MDGIWNAFGKIFSAIGLFIFYTAAFDYGRKSKSLWKSIIKGLLTVVAICLIANMYLGSHTENCDSDPVYGNCERVQDYEPTSKQYLDNFLFWFTYGSIPVVYGLYKGKQKAELEKYIQEQEQKKALEMEKNGGVTK